MKVVATKRSAQGTGASRRLRHTGKVPGVLYGGKADAQAIEVDHNDLFHALRKEKFHASILDMDLDGNSERVLLRAFQMHPYKPQVLHIDFQRVAEDQKIHMRVPLHFTGQENSPAVKVSGGLISHVLSDIDVACLPKDLPEFIEVDLSGLNAHETVRVLDLKLPAGVTPVLKGKENPVVVAVSTHGETAEEEAVVAAPASADVPATAQKAPAAPAAEAAKGGKEAKGGDKKK
ncbi:MAG: 50S ribosomal protein L25/general stress protein Ctc [Burkholderiaceae bacterium]|jgi:large subunit ribosomal protein L25|nr:50S ribosomal protein L25/general stress protein Ctc [Burkholderiaceae bacterium]MDH5209240.1 50S ribosomal protein L25/general stress protein Ctc [Burkholderiaceae bacterium]